MVLQRGAWSLEEDQKLISYISRFGIWNWSEIPNHAGLSRTSKSCRLRWVNYLRPGIKRGNISTEEEETIVKLHSVLGNRWATIAAKLPQRTDNEIKNFWKTRMKKQKIESLSGESDNKNVAEAEENLSQTGSSSKMEETPDSNTYDDLSEFFVTPDSTSNTNDDISEFFVTPDSTSNTNDDISEFFVTLDSNTNDDLSQFSITPDSNTNDDLSQFSITLDSNTNDDLSKFPIAPLSNINDLFPFSSSQAVPVESLLDLEDYIVASETSNEAKIAPPNELGSEIKAYSLLDSYDSFYDPSYDFWTCPFN
ncbi:hypothetical protein PTKIN_Ptkin16aG0058900 [Pterospermum kingtungense]